MMRPFVALLVCAFAGASQEPTPAISLVDAVVLDAAGNPITTLTAADFEITAGGKPVEAVRLTAFDAAAHTASTRTKLPALELTPDQIHRTTILVIDDLCLSLAALSQAKLQARRFVEVLLAPGDQAAILRTSGGSGRERRITSDKRELLAVIDTTESLGAGYLGQTCASAAWSAVAYAASGLEPVMGRKAILLLSGGELPDPSGNVATEIERRASASMTAIYVGLPAAAAFAASVAGDAGATIDRVVAESRSFYVLAILARPGQVVVKVRRPGAIVRSHRHSLAVPLPPEFAEVPDEQDLLTEAFKSPFGATSIGVRMTTLFTNTAAEGSVIEVLCHIDARDLSYLRDEQGRYHLALEAGAASVPVAGAALSPAMGSSELHLTEEEYQRIQKDGLPTSLRVRWGAGARDVRVVIADRRSGRMGSANVFTQSNSLESGNFFLSGIGLLGNDTVREGPSVRQFRAGSKISYLYNIFNPTVDAQGRSRLEVQSRLIAGGREAFNGKPSEVVFEGGTEPHRRQVNGHIELDPSIAAGRYVLQVTVVDKLAPQPRSTGQFIDFTVAP